MLKAIPYYRVSTKRQGQSGLGLEAQRVAVRYFAKFKGLKLIKEFIEVESAATEKRPVLKKALTECKKRNAILLLAKQDRLSRKVLFISPRCPEPMAQDKNYSLFECIRLSILHTVATGVKTDHSST